MEHNTSQTGTSQGETLPQTEVPQHLLENNLSSETASEHGGPASPMSHQGGPQFNETVTEEPNHLFSVLQDAKTNGWGIRFFSWIQENKQLLLGVSGSLILAVIAITAIRSYVPTPAITTDNQISALVASAENSLANNTISIDPAFLISGDVTTQEVVHGDGITHLARRAVTARIQGQGLALSPEQRIYAEDFVQNAVGTHTLHIGEKLSIPYELIDSAITASQSLSEAQLQNLSQYTAQVIF